MNQRLLLAAALLCFLVNGFAQQGSGGRMGGPGLDGPGVSYRHILTPGDKGDWPVTARAGETLIVFATSGSFDPALELVDKDGKVLAQNDDIRPGDQDALILYRFPGAGQYEVLVKGYKSAGGGEYRITFRKFLASDAKLGARTAGSIPPTGNQWIRFPVQAGQTMMFTARASTYQPNLALFAPNGEEIGVQGESLVGDRYRRLVFRADVAGDYYAQIREAPAGASYAALLADARARSISIGAATGPQHLSPGGLDIWTFQGKAGDLVHLESGAQGSALSLSVIFVPPAKPDESAPDEDAGSAIVVVGDDEKKRGALDVVLRRNGTYQVSISHAMDAESNYNLAIKIGARPWPGGDVASILKLAAAEYWQIEGKKGDILRLEGKADQFDLEMWLLDSRGETVVYNDDGGGGTNPLITGILPSDGKYFVKAACFHHGGSGPYRLHGGPSPLKPLALNAKGLGTIGERGVDIWSFTGHAGESIAVSVRSDEFDTFVRLIGPDGLEVAVNDDGGEGTNSLLSVKLPLNGIYTIWVSGRGSGHFIVRWFDLER